MPLIHIASYGGRHSGPEHHGATGWVCLSDPLGVVFLPLCIEGGPCAQPSLTGGEGRCTLVGGKELHKPFGVPLSGDLCPLPSHLFLPVWTHGQRNHVHVLVL